MCPICLQTTIPSVEVNPDVHTDPQTPLTHTSSLPLLTIVPLTRRTSPSLQLPGSEKGKVYKYKTLSVIRTDKCIYTFNCKINKAVCHYKHTSKHGTNLYRLHTILHSMITLHDLTKTTNAILLIK